jgi:hypothetical protein
MKPYQNWIMNEKTGEWEPPKEKPNDNFYWDEEKKDWIDLIKEKEKEIK